MGSKIAVTKGLVPSARLGISVVELFILVVVILLIIAIVLPSLARARQLAKRQVCASNMRGIGLSCVIYANENVGLWPAPAFSDSATSGGFRYLATSDDPGVPVLVGYQRSQVTQYDEGPTSPGSTEASVTRALWMTLRNGTTIPKMFVCPSSDDVPDPTENPSQFFDFANKRHVSYGYRVPFGPRATRPSDSSDPRLIMAADASPFYLDPGSDFSWIPPGQMAPPRWDDNPSHWRPYNSGNHGGRGFGEGQNVLFTDGHVEFVRTPLAGIDRDNVYTVMGEGVSEAARIYGTLPHRFPGLAPPSGPHPGMRASDAEPDLKDSLTYP